MPMLLTHDRSSYQAAYQRFMIPLGPICLASYIDSLNLPIKIIVHDDLETVLKFKPDIIGLSCVSENFGFAQRSAQKIKEKSKSFIIIGGPHFTSLPTFLPDCFDAGVIGEGEIALEQIIKSFIEKGVSKESIKDIPGVVLKIDNNLISNPRSPQIKNLDSLPIPNRRKWAKEIGVAHMVTTRGCVYRCFFCAEPVIYSSFRAFSASRVVKEIENILENFPNVNHIRFYDDIFPVNKARMREICDLIEKKHINKKISFSCFIHAKLVDEEIVTLLKKMNFSFVQFGADSGSASVLKEIKPNTTLELNQKAIDLFYKQNLKIGLTFIVGNPSETAEDLNATYNFIVKNKEKIFDVEVSPAVTLPGTDLWKFAEKEGLIPPLEKMNWDFFRDSANLVDFDLSKYLYIALKIQPDHFISMIKKLKALVEEVHQLHGTLKFYKDNYVTIYKPASFKDLN